MGNPIIMFKNYPDGVTTITANSDNTNVGRVSDYMTTLAWKPVALTSQVDFAGTFTANCVCIAGANLGSTECTIKIYNDSAGSVVNTVLNFRDNQPAVIVFPQESYTGFLRVEFVTTSTTLEVGEIAIGDYLEFPRNVSVGYQPARWKNNDLVTQVQTEGNQFAGSIVRTRSRVETFKIPLIATSWMDLQWETFINDASGYPAWFLWDNEKPSSDAVYGNWEASQPSYINSSLSEVNMTIKGVA